ncbi:hypothetical protein [Streptomyces sp. NPDC127103]|uniref:hypothetical protein n=1 Tax=Streptomyces sp. NPDC127103 TaxID=3347139 RepID=UPI00365F25E3
MTGTTVLSGGGTYVPLPGGRVLTPDGYAVDAETLRRALASTPANTWRSRESRMVAYVAWCRERGRLHTDAGTLADYGAALAGRRHPAETIAVYTSTVAERLAAVGTTVPESERALIRAIVSQRAQEEARDDGGQGDVLQATECTREDLAAMLATLDRTTVEGIRDAWVLSLDWYMAGRASEPASLNLRDVTDETIRLVDPETGELVELAALVITLRLSKTNPYGKTTDTIRIAEQDDSTCPVAAYRAWVAVLAKHGVTSGPLLRRVKNGRLTTAGRPPKDPTRAGGIGDRTVRNIIASAARAAGLTRPLGPEERAVMSTAAERAELAALVLTDAGREALTVRRRLARRALRRSLPRYSGHSMRRGKVREDQRGGAPRHVIERQNRYVPGSNALARYLDDIVAWDENPTLPARFRRATPDPVRSRPTARTWMREGFPDGLLVDAGRPVPLS